MIRIAVVEDDKSVREGLEVLLKGSPGLVCTGTYSNGEDALEGLAETHPDVVLMDINLPGISGIDCMTSLRDSGCQMLFIMLTVFEDPDAIFNSLAAGASGFLLKNTSPSKLIESIEEVYRGGSPMSSEIARKVVDSFRRSPPSSKANYQLTNRENEVLSLLARGYLYKEIANHIHISIDTVRSHIRHIYDKLQVKTRTEAVIKYLEKS